MRRGAFQHMDHNHFFEPTPVGTVMKDVYDYGSPLGTLGRFADWLFLERYMRRLLAGRNQVPKQLA